MVLFWRAGAPPLPQAKKNRDGLHRRGYEHN